MKTKIALSLIVCAFIFGCANSATRFALDQGEGVYTYSHETTKDQISAFFLAEEWLSINIQDANKVVTLRQPETGILVAKPSILVPVAAVQFWGRYTLRITCEDNKLNTLFTVGVLENGVYPPKNAMQGIEDNFRSLSDGLHEYVENN